MEPVNAVVAAAMMRRTLISKAITGKSLAEKREGENAKEERAALRQSRRAALSFWRYNTLMPSRTSSLTILAGILSLLAVIVIGVLLGELKTPIPTDLSLSVTSSQVLLILAIVFTQLGSGWLAIIISLWAIIALALTMQWRNLATWILSIGIVGISIPILKILFHIPRPLSLLVETVGFSYPSGHTATATSLCVLILLISLSKYSGSRKIIFTSICILVPLLVGTSRLLLGAHSFIDILGGLLLGTGVTLICFGLLRPRIA